MMPLVTVGPLRLSTYGLVLLVLTMIWWWWCEQRIARTTNRDAELLLFQLILGAWLGAHLVAAIGSNAVWAQLLNIRSLEFSWFGACLGALSALELAHRRAQWQPHQIVAGVAIPTLLVQAGGAVGMYVAGMGLGTPWNGWWAVDMAGMLRHPTPLYEALVALIGAGVCARIQVRRPHLLPHAFVGAIAGNWLLVESFRASSWSLLGFVNVLQLCGLILLIVVIERVKMANERAST